jgi:hypothetical protein
MNERFSSTPQLDRISRHPYNNKFTVIHFFDSMNCTHGPAATCRAALFL